MSMGRALVLAAAITSPGAAAAAQEVRSDGRIYFEAESSLRIAEIEAGHCGSHIEPALREVSDLRDRLHRVRGFARTGGELERLWREAATVHAAGGEELCVSRRGIELNLQRAQQDIILLEQRVRSADHLASGQ